MNWTFSGENKKDFLLLKEEMFPSTETRKELTTKVTQAFDASNHQLGPILNKSKLQQLALKYPHLAYFTWFNFQQNKIRKIDLCRHDVEELQLFHQALVIDLSHNLFASMDFKNAAFYHAIRLNLSFNCLTQIKSLGYFKNLRELSLSHNRLTCLHFLMVPSLNQTLQVLHVDHNLFSRLRDIGAVVHLSALQHLSLYHNPLPLNYAVEAFVIYSCPKLITFGKSHITQYTRNRVQSWFDSDKEGHEMKQCIDAFRDTLSEFLKHPWMFTSVARILHTSSNTRDLFKNEIFKPAICPHC